MVHSADSAGCTVHPAKGYKYQVMNGRFNKKEKKTGKPKKIDKHNTETMYSVASNKQLTWITVSCCAWHSSTLACETIENNFKTRHRVIANTLFCRCYHGNATRALAANPPNSTQLGGIPYHSSKLHPGPCKCGHAAADRQTDTHRREWPQYILHRIQLMRNVTN